MTTLTLFPASRVREALPQAPALNLPNEVFGRPVVAVRPADRPGFARRFLLALVCSLAVPAA